MKRGELTVALIGNPNVGKTAFFNALTGARQHIGNWPGVTVEKKEGYTTHRGVKIHVVDLPGVYSLSAHSIDEKIARDYVVKEKPDVVVDIVDATNLERNLYLTLQLLEIHTNVVVALNMMDEAEKRNIKIDIKKLGEFLGVPVVPTVAIESRGIEELLEAVIDVAEKGVRRKIEVGYGRDVERAIALLERKLQARGKICRTCAYAGFCGGGSGESRWIAVRLLEGDEDISGVVEKDVLHTAEKIRKELMEKIGDVQAYMAEKRYQLIEEIVHQCVSGGIRETITDKIDRVLLSREFGIPVFIVIMWMAFKITFDVAAPLADAIDVGFALLASWINENIADPTVASLLTDGLIGGVGSVLVFIPNIFMLFLVLSFLEDSGYLSRAAFVMDRAMYKIGLHGKSFIPFLLGFGCNVPAIMATRTIENENDRVITILVNPLISCSARLPVYVLFASLFFPGAEAGVILSLYLLGIILAVAIALLLRKTVFSGEPSPFIMEMPPYRLPTLKSISIHMWERGIHFIKKAGMIIFLGSIIIWFLASYPTGDVETSYLATIGRSMQPIFSPLGWSWGAVVALIFGFVAKEIVVGTFGVLYGVEEESLTSPGSPLHAEFNPVGAYAYMAFVLIYTPCIATLATIWQETRRVKWVAFAVAYELLLAYLVALLITVIGGGLI